MNIWLAEIWQSWRASLRRPGFLLLASGVLALGIGSSVGIFTLIEQVVMQPLPLPEPSRVMIVGRLNQGQIQGVSPRQYEHMQPLDGTASMGLLRTQVVNIAGGGPPETVSAIYMDRTLLPTLGLPAVLGRGFTAREDQPHGPHVAMLGYRLWQHRYGGSSDVLGKTLDVEGVACTIVGVLPQRFDALGFGSDVALPMALPSHSTRNATNYIAVARLTDGASREAVTAQINARMHAMFAAMPSSTYAAFGLQMHFAMAPISAWRHHDASAKLKLFMVCALFVLLTALVNLINLMLLRSLARTHDSAVRGALGAAPLRLALPALAEGLLIGVLGAIVGVAWATLGLRVLEHVLSVDWLPAGGLRVVPWAWLLALGVSVACAVLAAAFGVWRSRARPGVDALREGGRHGVSRQRARLGHALVVAQVVLATVLLCGTGMLLHGLYKVVNTPLGFSSDHMLVFNLRPLQADYPDVAAVSALSRRLVDRLQAIPGVSEAAVTSNLPTGTPFYLPVRKRGSGLLMNQFRAVGPGFFKLFAIPVLHGRGFTYDDRRAGVAVAVVNRAFADKVFGGHALSQTIAYGLPSRMTQVHIVGVVGNTRQFGPLKPAPAMLYVPLAQMAGWLVETMHASTPLRFVLHGSGNASAWRAAVRAAVAEVAPGQPVSDFRTMNDVIRSTTAPTRRAVLLIGTFAVLALLLAAAGLYAVMAVAVVARHREFGVRMALGAKPSRLVRMVLRGGLARVVGGLVIGVGIVAGVSGLLQRLLVALVARTNTLDPIALLGVCAVLLIVAVLACLLPALRAGRVQPMHALRGE